MSKQLIALIVLALLLAGCSKASSTQTQPATSVASNQVQAVTPTQANTAQTQAPATSTESNAANTQPTPPAPAKVPAAKPSSTQKQPTPTPAPTFTPATDRHAWWYTPNDSHSTPVITTQYKNFLAKYHGFYTYNTSKKIIYLTFDAGESPSFAGEILDTLKANNLKASFFVTKPFIVGSPDMVKRMVNEGHVVGNHTVTHRDMNLLSEAEIRSELTEVEKTFSSVTGAPLAKYIRPPSGCFNERSLWVTDQMGYKTVFWSWAYKDWDQNNQPSKETLLNLIQTRSHNGEIILLHAASKTDADNLQDVINILRGQGYSFGQISDF